ncbi:uncharacterized protein LY89DRAFT_739892 [Mollisia scopiformis]|uniref:Uncharacterized protein n=1 Tax=Mollisia scopiformis TaxID=149040 RepID=A0A194WSH4_MOLSC|nr:uncharacterized protein LY89DRAFT_739892 [Mollisia scopiformis]KUJ10911.1 hypothetical protein LY89DRAFT_739892 [Mollisia scopiformis]
MVEQGEDQIDNFIEGDLGEEVEVKRYTPAEAKALMRAERTRRELWYYNDGRKCRVNVTQEIKEVKEAAILEFFNAPTAKKKFVFMNFPKIRDQILEDLLVLAIGILPGQVYHDVKTGKNKEEVGVYSYQWSTHRQGHDEHNLPRYDGTSRRIRVACT